MRPLSQHIAIQGFIVSSSFTQMSLATGTDLDPDCLIKSPYVAGYETRGLLFDQKDFFLQNQEKFTG